MALLDLYLIALHPGISIGAFLEQLQQHGIQPIIQAQVVRWMIRPTQLSADYLLNRNIHWDLLLGLEATAPSPSTPSASAAFSSTAPLQASIAAAWTVTCGVSSRTLAGYAAHNTTLLREHGQHAPPPPLPAPASVSADAQALALSRELAAWLGRRAARLPVSMLNLLAFRHDARDGSTDASHAAYVEYGRAFSARVGARHGGHVKVAARVVPAGLDRGGSGSGSADTEHADADGARWDEIAFVHYPSVRHFAAMVASDDYQAVNRQHRLGALQDTFILCVAEVDGRGELLVKSADDGVREKGKL
jgi:hypothetical protein